MALARTSGQVLANPDNMAVFCSGRKQLELQKTLQLYVYLQIHQPMAAERENGELHLCQNSGLSLDRYAQANETRSACVKSQLICS